MARKTRSAGQSPLSHYWAPPAATCDGGCGEPWVCLASTYEFDAAFFESELLPRFLGLKFDHTENEPSFLVEREEALALARVAVLVDHSRFNSSQTTLRWDQIPIQIPRGIQHAKITVLAWEKLIRVIIGSANLTRMAYRRNREIFAALDFWNSEKSTPLRLLRDIFDALALMLQWSRASAEAVQRARDILDRLQRTTRGWNDAPAEFAGRQRPRVSLALTHPRSGRRPARSTLSDVIQQWGNRRASHVTVVSPFTAPDPDAGVGDQTVNKLAELAMTRECEGWLVLPELPRTANDKLTRLPFPKVFKESWKRIFHGKGNTYVLPLPLCVEGTDDRNRPLHSKCIILESRNDDFAMMMIGSSNFTPRGMGVGIHNFEANLIFEDDGSAKRGALRLTDRLGLPRAWDDAVSLDEVEWKSPDEPPEDEPDPRPALPDFFAWATYSQTTGELKLSLDRQQDEPERWSVRLPGGESEAPTLFAKDMEPIERSSKTLVRALPKSMHAANIVALLVEWNDANGALQQSKLAVSVEGEEHLCPPQQFLKLDADSIIECLISGKSPAQWFDQINRKQFSAGGGDAAGDSLRAVDTSSFLLYRVRRFGRALTAMSHRVMGTIPVPDAIRYRLLKDPFGPVSLAQSLLPKSEEQPGGFCAQLDDEHRHFLLAEIVLTVSYLRPRLVRKARGKEKKEIEAMFLALFQQLQQFADGIPTESPLPQNLHDYLVRVQSLSSQLAAQAPEAQGVD